MMRDFIDDLGLWPMLLILLCVSTIIFFSFDLGLGKRKNELVLVYEKQFIPAYTETYIDLESHIVNNQTITIPVTKHRYHPDEYIFYVDDYERRYTLHTNAQTFFSVNPRKEVQTRFVQGKWTKLKYFEQVTY